MAVVHTRENRNSSVARSHAVMGLRHPSCEKLFWRSSRACRYICLPSHCSLAHLHLSLANRSTVPETWKWKSITTSKVVSWMLCKWAVMQWDDYQLDSGAGAGNFNFYFNLKIYQGLTFVMCYSWDVQLHYLWKTQHSHFKTLWTHNSKLWQEQAPTVTWAVMESKFDIQVSTGLCKQKGHVCTVGRPESCNLTDRDVSVEIWSFESKTGRKTVSQVRSGQKSIYTAFCYGLTSLVGPYQLSGHWHHGKPTTQISYTEKPGWLLNLQLKFHFKVGVKC